MKRQMFNQGGYVHPQRMNLGGPPIAPPPMGPPPMGPPPMGPEQALAGAEAQGQEMGMLAAEGVMQNIDGAQDYQSLIDGIRGNEQPLEARYAELGSIVGEQDEIVDQIQRLEAAGLKEVTMLPPVAQMRENFTDFAEQIIPQMR